MDNLPIVQYFIEKCAKIEAEDNLERTPLHKACEKGHLPIIQYLIEKGANIEAKDEHQKTPLQIASEYGQTDIVKFLASKNDQDSDKSQRNITREPKKQKDCNIG